MSMFDLCPYNVYRIRTWFLWINLYMQREKEIEDKRQIEEEKRKKEEAEEKRKREEAED